MIRQRLLWHILGRRLVERLLLAGWITPVRVGGAIYYDRQAVHLALRRVQREGYLINGHLQNGFPATIKVRKPRPENAFKNFELDF